MPAKKETREAKQEKKKVEQRKKAAEIEQEAGHQLEVARLKRTVGSPAGMLCAIGFIISTVCALFRALPSPWGSYWFALWCFMGISSLGSLHALVSISYLAYVWTYVLNVRPEQPVYRALASICVGGMLHMCTIGSVGLIRIILVNLKLVSTKRLTLSEGKFGAAPKQEAQQRKAERRADQIAARCVDEFTEFEYALATAEIRSTAPRAHKPALAWPRSLVLSGFRISRTTTLARGLPMRRPSWPNFARSSLSTSGGDRIG